MSPGYLSVRTPAMTPHAVHVYTTHLTTDLEVQGGWEGKKHEASCLDDILFVPTRMLPGDSSRRCYGGSGDETVAIGESEAIHSIARERNAVVSSQQERRVEED